MSKLEPKRPPYIHVEAESFKNTIGRTIRKETCINSLIDCNNTMAFFLQKEKLRVRIFFYPNQSNIGDVFSTVVRTRTVLFEPIIG